MTSWRKSKDLYEKCFSHMVVTSIDTGGVVMATASFLDCDTSSLPSKAATSFFRSSHCWRDVLSRGDMWLDYSSAFILMVRTGQAGAVRGKNPATLLYVA